MGTGMDFLFSATQNAGNKRFQATSQAVSAANAESQFARNLGQRQHEFNVTSTMEQKRADILNAMSQEQLDEMKAKFARERGRWPQEDEILDLILGQTKSDLQNPNGPAMLINGTKYYQQPGGNWAPQ